METDAHTMYKMLGQGGKNHTLKPSHALLAKPSSSAQCWQPEEREPILEISLPVQIQFPPSPLCFLPKAFLSSDSWSCWPTGAPEAIKVRKEGGAGYLFLNLLPSNRLKTDYFCALRMYFITLSPNIPQLLSLLMEEKRKTFYGTDPCICINICIKVSLISLTWLY